MPTITNMRRVIVVKDTEDSLYIIPIELKDKFFEFVNKKVVDSTELNAFYEEFGDYRTNDDLNTTDLYVKNSGIYSTRGK
jgi:hypothetical protein